MQIVEGRLTFITWSCLVKVVNELIQASWAFALTRVVNEMCTVAEGPFEFVLALTEIISDVVQFVESMISVVAEKLIRIISEVIVVYDSLTRIIAKAVMGFIWVIGDAIGVSETRLKKITRDRRITIWKHRR